MGIAYVPDELRPRQPPGTILDVGSGGTPQTLFEGVTVSVDSSGDRLGAAIGIRINADWQAVLPLILPNSFDAVTALDFIEHLPRQEGFHFIREAQRIAPYVLVFTPLGFMKQDTGDPLQLHRSGWEPSDFPDWGIEVDPIMHAQGAFWAAWWDNQ